MKNILFLNNQKIVNGKVKRLSEHLVQLTGVEQNLGGFEVLTPKGKSLENSMILQHFTEKQKKGLF